ncbi:MAG TPA: acyl-CoA dehydrogenase family protein [Anaeromyxobacteraceae bacterium]|nr:acyl-CoA dehydrogenase family protein [Anaeromyxobacteraceae bacterium]
MDFLQEPPRLENTFDGDPLLQEYLARTLPPELLAAEAPALRALGELAAGELLALQEADRRSEPVLTPYDAWGRRIDRIEVTPLWRRAAGLAAREGLVALAYERPHGGLSRVVQLSRLYAVEPSLDVYACPLAMTDGAARTLLDHGPSPMVERAVPRLTARDPARAWTSGQWMTERTGGSDVGRSETVARRTPEGWRLFGVKWFTSATTSEMALTLARPEGAGPGGKGLALFYLEVCDAAGRPNGLELHRLKEKLGTRKVPTAELTLRGALAEPVAGLADGVKAMSPMLEVTRTWNAVAAAAGMQRALALAADYARHRVAFGAPLAAKPLHADTLAGVEAEREGAFLLAFRAVELLGRKDAGEASEAERLLLRALVPVAKLTTGKQAVAVASEALEAFGGAGYVEDTGLPRLLRDAQVLPIWEGTTNVLSLDLLRALGKPEVARALAAEVARPLAALRDPSLRPCAEVVERALAHARGWLEATAARPAAREGGARRLALTLGRALELSLLAAHAQWCLDAGRGRRALLAARRLARSPIDLVDDLDPAEALELLGTQAGAGSPGGEGDPG